MCAVALLSSTALLVVVFGILGATLGNKNYDGSSSQMQFSTANSEAIALADCLAKERGQRLVDEKSAGGERDQSSEDGRSARRNLRRGGIDDSSEKLGNFKKNRVSNYLPTMMCNFPYLIQPQH